MKWLQENKRKYICMTAALLSAGLLTGIFVQKSVYKVDKKVRETQEKLAKEVLRFHVLANSDSKEDQALKMQVKEAVIRYMKEELPNAKNAEETKNWARGHLLQLEQEAGNIIAAKGYDYPVKAEVTTDYFPDKKYGDVTFPAGEYEALRIEIGKAKGHNWWCVLYPNLCFTDAVKAVVPEKRKKGTEKGAAGGRV